LRTDQKKYAVWQLTASFSTTSSSRRCCCWCRIWACGLRQNHFVL